MVPEACGGSESSMETGSFSTDRIRLMKLWKITPWLLILTGLVWTLTVLRNLYLPEFLNFSHLSHAEKVSYVPLQLAAGVLCLVAGVGSLWSAKRNMRAR